MAKGSDDKKGGVKGIKGSGGARGAQKTGAVEGIEEVQKATATGKVKGVERAQKSGANKPMTLAEREELLKMISQEADKLFGKSGVPNEQREVVEEAVKMAVDSVLVDEEEENKTNKKK